jgi:hypothetical protein
MLLDSMYFRSRTGVITLILAKGSAFCRETTIAFPQLQPFVTCALKNSFACKKI